MEACTLDLYQKNIFRITGLPVDATAKEVAKQAQRLQMLEEIGGGIAGTQPAFPLKPAPTTEQIRGALARMREPEHRLVDELFWYWPETFGRSKEESAIQALLAGDAQQAIAIWTDREKHGSIVARHNLAIMYHMFAVDWTNHHISSSLNPDQSRKMREYWQNAFERWEMISESDDFWNLLKKRVQSLEDDALTTGFVRRMRSLLPQALNRVNAEAALKFAETGNMEWAGMHVEFMRQTNPSMDDVQSTAELVLRPTRKRIKQQLESSLAQVKRSPQQGSEIASNVIKQCRPLMDIYDLFYGKKAHQRNDLLDEVAETVVELVVGHQKTTGDNRTFVNLLKEALKFATGTHVRERIMKNIAIGEGNLEGEMVAPLYKILHAITESSITAAQKLHRIQTEILSEMPNLASRLGTGSSAYRELADSLALAIRGVSIDAHNDSKDYRTAEAAIWLALRLAIEQETKRRINEDIKALANSKKNSLCFYCGVESSNTSSEYSLPMYGDVTRQYRTTHYRTATIPIQRCKTCADKHDSSRNYAYIIGGVLAVIGLCVGGPIGIAVGLVVGWIVFMVFKSNGPEDVSKHPAVQEMSIKGWSIGNKPR